jgi:hypothetical protein
MACPRCVLAGIFCATYLSLGVHIVHHAASRLATCRIEASNQIPKCLCSISHPEDLASPGCWFPEHEYGGCSDTPSAQQRGKLENMPVRLIRSYVAQEAIAPAVLTPCAAQRKYILRLAHRRHPIVPSCWPHLIAPRSFIVTFISIFLPRAPTRAGRGYHPRELH